MFIKVFVPNANGKIELSVQELEALLKDAVTKAVNEKCANCNRCWYDGTTTTPYNTPYITCSTSSATNKLEDNITYLNGGLTVESLNGSDRTNNAKMVNYTVTATSNKGE
jgi:hypothetical protein